MMLTSGLKFSDLAASSNVRFEAAIQQLIHNLFFGCCPASIERSSDAGRW